MNIIMFVYTRYIYLMNNIVQIIYLYRYYDWNIFKRVLIMKYRVILTLLDINFDLTTGNFKIVIFITYML